MTDDTRKRLGEALSTVTRILEAGADSGNDVTVDNNDSRWPTIYAYAHNGVDDLPPLTTAQALAVAVLCGADTGAKLCDCLMEMGVVPTPTAKPRCEACGAAMIVGEPVAYCPCQFPRTLSHQVGTQTLSYVTGTSS
jgi:hypothetical protein